MYPTECMFLHYILIWNVFFKVHKVVDMSVSVSKLSLYTDVNPCKQKKAYL